MVAYLIGLLKLGRTQRSEEIYVLIDLCYEPFDAEISVDSYWASSVSAQLILACEAVYRM